MFAKTKNGYGLIGERKEDILYSLDTGLYTLEVTKSFFGKSMKFIPVDRYKTAKTIKAGIFKEASDHVENFFDDDMKYIRNEMGMFHKTSMILQGAPGTGKTHLACTLAQKLADQYDGLAIVVNDIDDLDFASLTDKLRINDSPDRMVIYVLDEIEKNSNSSLRSSKFLGFLDGAESRSNTIVIATANDISDMPSFLTNRPGRFEKIYEFSLKDKGILTATIGGILPEKYNTPEIVTEILEKALDNGVKTIDHLRFIVQDLLFAKIKASVDNKKIAKTINPVDKPAKRSKSTATSKSKVVA